MSSETFGKDTVSLVRHGIELANEAFSDLLPTSWISLISERAILLERGRQELAPGNLNIVIFHVKIPSDVGEIKAPDIRGLNHDKIDYETLIKLNIDIALKTNPRSRVFLITDDAFLSGFDSHPRLHISRIRVNTREPMFERVVTMASYVHSSLFCAPTIFLDTDAFLIRPVHNLFSNNFDLALTHRNISGQMPLNEGVIFANNISKKNVQQLFTSYVACYLNIEADPRVAEIYQNLRRWRGGQLALNSLGQGQQLYSTSLRKRGVSRIVVLPCSVYNLSEVVEGEITTALLRRSVVLHLKGMRKKWVNSLKSLFELP